MKEIFKIFKFVLLMCGVFGLDEDEVKSVSVMEGDSVTLNLDPTQIQGFIQIQWRFGKPGSSIAKIVEKTISYEDEEIFEDRLQLDQTGSLTIKNMRTKHSGRYKAEISHSSETFSTIFIVTVYGSPDVIDAVKGEMKLMSVTEGDPVILQTDVPQLTRDMLVVWRSGDEGKLIAKHDIEAKSSPFYDETDERFRDRLKLDQTGSLTITNTRTTDSGLYRVKISSNNQTTYKRFTVTVSVPGSGLSGGAVAGIVIGVLLAVAVAGLMYYYFLRPFTTKLPNQTWRVPAGDYITLNPETEIQRGDEIQWLFGVEETLIAEIKGEKREMKTYDGPDEIFKNKLKQGEPAGSLTIIKIRTKHSGPYTLKIRRGRETFYKRFIVSVRERWITETEGDPVTLKPAYEIKKDDVIEWLFGDREQQTVIAEFNVKTGEILTYDDVADGRFRDRLKLDKTTRSLTINNTRTTDAGVYKLQIISSSEVTEQTFIVTVRDKVEWKLLNKGDSVTLTPDTEIQRDDQILWMFGYQDKLIAQIRGGTVEIYDDVNERFRDRLKLDETGSLTITDTEAKHTGLYKLQIISSKEILCKRFQVSIKERDVKVTEGEPVHLYTDLTEIQRDEEIQWRFGDENSLIAEIKGGTVETHDGPDERFRDRLELNKKTGDLTINDSTALHTGHYTLKISSSKGKTNRTYIVKIRARKVTVTEGESVHLKTALTEIQRDDEIEWRFGYENSLIAENKGGTVETRDVPDKRFRDRLKLDETTGDLIIKNSTDEHAGRYRLKIRSSKGNTYWTYTVKIRARIVAVTVGDSVHLYTDLTEIQTDEEIEWRFGNKNSLIAEIKGGTGVTRDVPDKIFRDRLELDVKTGNLTIKNSTAEHAGYYKLKISSSKGDTNRTYIVFIRDAAVTKEARTESSMKEKTDSRRNRVNESVTVEMEKKPLLNRDDLNVVNEEVRTSSL